MTTPIKICDPINALIGATICGVGGKRGDITELHIKTSGGDQAYVAIRDGSLKIINYEG